MPNNENTTATELPEITKESIAACADAYAEDKVRELRGDENKKRVAAKIRVHWYSGFLAHANLMEPHNADMFQKFEEVYNEAEFNRSVLEKITGMYKRLLELDKRAPQSSDAVATRLEIAQLLNIE